MVTTLDRLFGRNGLLITGFCCLLISVSGFGQRAEPLTPDEVLILEALRSETCSLEDKKLKQLDQVSTAVIRESLLKEIGTALSRKTVGQFPIIVLDDQVIQAELIASLKAEKLASIDVVRGMAAVKLYGEKARFGAVRFVLKEEN